MKTKRGNKNVLFTLLDGEAFDYIGSSDMAFEMKSGKFPVDPTSSRDVAQIKLEHFSHFIELNQLSPHSEVQDKHKLWVHRDGRTDPDAKAQQLEKMLVNSAARTQTIEMRATDKGRPLPPSSLHTFLKENKSLTGVVIANHQNEYTNKYYNSIFDDIQNVNKSSKLVQNLADVSTAVSKTVYQLLTDQSKDSIVANDSLIQELVDCFLVNPSCYLFQFVSSDNSNSKTLD